MINTPDGKAKKRFEYSVFAVVVPLFTLLAALLAGELIMRLYFDSADFPMAGARKEVRGIGALAKARDLYVSDNRFGFRPVHDGRMHTEFGCKPNNYPLDKQESGRERLLFVGDSVTYRGKILDALRSKYGDADYEYWNAGVPAYGTAQEHGYYLAYNRRIRPDHVILTFHNNDFIATPVAYFDENDQLVRYLLRKPAPFPINSWLFKNSLMYRKVIDLSLTWRQPRHGDIVRKVEQSLVELKKAVEADGARFSVLVFPILAPAEQWKESEVRSHLKAREILHTHGIRYFDLLPALQLAVEKDIRLGQDPGDTWHPGKEVSAIFADHLADRHLL